MGRTTAAGSPSRICWPVWANPASRSTRFSYHVDPPDIARPSARLARSAGRTSLSRRSSPNESNLLSRSEITTGWKSRLQVGPRRQGQRCRADRARDGRARRAVRTCGRGAGARGVRRLCEQSSRARQEHPERRGPRGPRPRRLAERPARHAAAHGNHRKGEPGIAHASKITAPRSKRPVTAQYPARGGAAPARLPINVL